MLKLEAGKWYKTRDGHTVGPITAHPRGILFGTDCLVPGYQSGSTSDRLWYASGEASPGSERPFDLVSEVQSGLTLKEGEFYVDTKGTNYGPLVRLDNPVSTSSSRRGNPREDAVWAGEGSDGTVGARFFYADGVHVLEPLRDLVAMCGPADAALIAAFTRPAEQDSRAAQQAAEVAVAQSTGAPGKANDDECRRLCPSILNGHANECPYSRGVR